MSDCKTCQLWIKERCRKYDDGTRVTTFTASPRRGFCEVLERETSGDFGCRSYQPGANFDHIAVEKIAGAPWQNFTMGDCPECKGRGSGVEGGVCWRCVGTGKVRFYDDGFVGDERHRRHPNEPVVVEAENLGAILAPLPKPSVL